MKLWTALLFLLCIATLIRADGLPDPQSDTTAALRTLEQRKLDAQLHKNTAALDAMFDDGLMWVDESGTLFTKAGYLENLRNSASTHQLRIETMQVKIFDGVAIVFGIYEERGVSAGQPNRHHCRFIDTWAPKDGKWVLIAATATSTIS